MDNLLDEIYFEKKYSIVKEKAHELIDRFGNVLFSDDEGQSSAKKCALIAVEELISRADYAPFMSSGRWLFEHKNPYRFRDFWELVKKEIQKL